jgi:magnesium chelatase subunit I
MGVIPAITGKIELVYEGEQEGADTVAQILLEEAVKTLFPKYFPKIQKLEHKDAQTPYDGLISWFFEGEGFEITDESTDEEYKDALNSIPPLNSLIKKYQPDVAEADAYFLKEFLLWGMVAHKKLSKHRFIKGYRFKDLYGSFISKL